MLVSWDMSRAFSFIVFSEDTAFSFSVLKRERIAEAVSAVTIRKKAKAASAARFSCEIYFFRSSSGISSATGMIVLRLYTAATEIINGKYASFSHDTFMAEIKPAFSTAIEKRNSMANSVRLATKCRTA